MLATIVPGLLEVIGIPIAFVVLPLLAMTGIFILWNRARP
jgi:hypothetical protein